LSRRLQAPLSAMAPMQMLMRMLRFIEIPPRVEQSRKCAIFGI
jgi:hypothetical protein